MASEYKKQHYIPQTYLQSWNDKSEKIRVYDKKDTLYRYCKCDKVMYENDIYTKKAEDGLILTDEEKEEAFNILDGYKIIYKGKEEKQLTSIEEYDTYYYDFEKWTILREDGSVVRKKNIKDTIEKVRITVLEEQWKCIENDWEKLKNTIIKNISSGEKIENTDLDALVTFMVAQKWRTPKALQEYESIIDSILYCVKNNISNKIYDQEKKYLGTAVFKQQIEKFQKKDECSHIFKEINILKECHAVFYQPIQRKFITSDNPVITILNNDLFNENYNGIYFPISPELMLAMYRGDKATYSVRPMRSNIVRRINRHIKNQSLKYYITNYEL